MNLFKESHPELFETVTDSRGRVTFVAREDSKGVRHCGACGDPLQGRRARAFCGKTLQGTCLECGKLFEYPCDRHGTSREFCGGLCANKSAVRRQRAKATTRERYGVENVFALPEVREKALRKAWEEEAKEKRTATNLERFGAESNLQNPELNAEYRRRQVENHGGKLAFNTDKQRETMVERYGADHPSRVPELLEKAQETQRSNHGGKLAFNSEKQQETMVERYGAKGSLGSPELREKFKETMVERYGADHPSRVPELLEKAHKTLRENNGTLFSPGGQGSRYSSTNTKVRALAEDMGLKVTQEFPLKEAIFDFRLEGTNILLDINPTVTHSFQCLRNDCETPCQKHPHLPSDYHYKRALLAKTEGYRLIQFYDWDDYPRLLSFVAGKVGPVRKFSGRKLTLRELSKKETDNFLSSTHLQGTLRDQSYRYGLFSGEELLAVATFGKSRFKAKASHEWLRYALKPGVLIHGGAGVLFKRFLEDSQAESVISYVDFNHTTGETFLPAVGFQEVKPTGPVAVWYKKGHKRITSSSLVALGADKLLGTSYGPRSNGLTNEGIMLQEGWLKVYSAGSRVFLWKHETFDTMI